MHLSEIENLLYDSMGLNTASIGSSAVMSAVEQRMSECNLKDLKKYTEKVISDKNELQELIEEVVVAETWFFRDKKPFDMLAQFIKREWTLSESDKPVRVLSLPCATGEEPYSIAITLIEAGLMPSQLKIDAFDISVRNIERCKKAHYSENSFRGVDPYIRDRFFNIDNNRYYPDILIKAMVNFEVASIFDPVFINTQIPYDVIFCRNLLIYFDRKTQAVTANTLNKLLNQNGLLFVGHAETSIFSKKWHLSQRYRKSFIVRKINDGDVSKSKIVKNKTIGKNINKKLKSRVIVRSSTRLQSLSKTKLEKPVINKINSTLSDNNLMQARQLADCGNLLEAEILCVKYMENNKQDKDVYHLLATIQLALGDEQKSAQYFKNVIYLDPNHHDALMYLSTLLGNEGDEPGAARYRERAFRAKNKRNKMSGKA